MKPDCSSVEFLYPWRRTVLSVGTWPVLTTGLELRPCNTWRWAEVVRSVWKLYRSQGIFSTWQAFAVQHAWLILCWRLESHAKDLGHWVGNEMWCSLVFIRETTWLHIWLPQIRPWRSRGSGEVSLPVKLATSGKLRQYSYTPRQFGASLSPWFVRVSDPIQSYSKIVDYRSIETF